MRVHGLLTGLLATILISGCSSGGLEPGEITSRYDPATREIPRLEEVRQAGTYELVTTNTGQVVHRSTMRRGAFYGFRMDDEIATGFAQESDGSGGVRDVTIRIDDAGDRTYAWRVVSVEPK